MKQQVASALGLGLGLVLLPGCGGTSLPSYARSAQTAKHSADDIVEAVVAAQRAGVHEARSIPDEAAAGTKAVYEVAGSPPVAVVCEAFKANTRELDLEDPAAQALLDALWLEAESTADGVANITFACAVQAHLPPVP